ncbi:putative late blight resistance protein homolog R1B-23 [Coffea eugenioides]|uniref:putative late blight resistance protein homolog R1B-23 n=1 Tax=Coffea eugenioides TaxID=49369 RepID=UPI000F60B43E|nr:putative late blight resistance protein homolog R1B-23 [Coffea eugenioides]XP_027151210.1 putative late blight resistance protein homolog R1B-23 [Coffea eugenioides]XP_027151211.1 putative late blight resistance protein homolog R1B-23 [Coffea eugenioides]XP_027151212.1 putative late blight resistance protein homolog R1B-23 [Coffea eugenioides]
MPRQIEALYRSSSAEEFIGNKVKDSLYKFLVNAMLFKAKALVLNLLDSDASLIVPMKRQIGTLHEALVFVIESTLSQPKENEEDEKQILTYIEAVAARVISLCNSFSADQTTEEAVTKMDFWLSDSLEIIQLLTPKFKELYLQIPRLHFPKTPQLGFVEFLLQKLRQLLRQKLDSVQHVIHQIESIHEDLEMLMSFFRHSLKQGIGNQEHEDLRTHLIVLAYEAECVIDSIVIGGSAEWNHLPWLYHVSQEIRHVKMQAIDLHEKESCDIGNCNAPQTLWPSLPQASTTNIDEEVVVLNDQQQVLIDKLTRGSSQRDVVSIVGMPGIGKTTLAFKVYNDPEVVCYFHIRAWCRVSQAYSRRSLLLDILRHIIELNDTILAMSNEDLDLVLYKHLKKNRYLIFMDDMWSIRAWDDFKISFPDDGNGSRILMTSRLCDVVSKVTPECNLLNLRLLSDDESWELLKLKIFHQESYPEELFEVGKEIARNCKGLLFLLLQ